jgi:hypothetical protein
MEAREATLQDRERNERTRHQYLRQDKSICERSNRVASTLDLDRSQLRAAAYNEEEEERERFAYLDY